MLGTGYIKTFAAAILLMSVALLPAMTWAAGLVPCEGLNCEVKDLFGIFVGIFNFLLGLTGLTALFFLVWGGIQMFFVAATDSSIENAKKTIANAIIGILIVACSYMIVNTVIFFLGGGDLKALFGRLGIPGIF